MAPPRPLPLLLLLLVVEVEVEVDLLLLLLLPPLLVALAVSMSSAGNWGRSILSAACLMAPTRPPLLLLLLPPSPWPDDSSLRLQVLSSEEVSWACRGGGVMDVCGEAGRRGGGVSGS
jgi:hypothetical protein